MKYLKVNLVGVGSTNSLSVVRGQMGTVAAAHTVGAAVTVLKGDYRINEGRIVFFRGTLWGKRSSTRK